MNTTESIKQAVQDKILAQLDKGIVPWQKPWKGGIRHHNLVSGHVYRGINIWLLGATDFSTPYWMTFKQANAQGWSVKKGEHASDIVFWDTASYPVRDSKGEVITLPNGRIKTRKAFRLVMHKVFNADQVKGVVLPVIEDDNKHDPINEAQAIIDGYVASSKVTFTVKQGNDRACYSPALDAIEIPALGQFTTAEEYYSTAFHECVHSTGHKSRLARLDTNKVEHMDDSYSFEELVAESGACMLDAMVGIDTDKIYQNATAYIKTWRDRIANDASLVIKASSRASTAVDYIMGIKPKVHEEVTE